MCDVLSMRQLAICLILVSSALRCCAMAETGPVQTSTFIVKDYGAKGDSTSDDTAAFQSALNAASAAGGGTVLVPVGTYRIAGHLDLPSRVALVGMWQSPARFYGKYEGSTLLAVEGAGNADGTPFIQMHAESAIKGLTIAYPDQSKTAPVAYPWCIRGEGDNNAIIDVLLLNPWQAVDFGTFHCGRHYIRGLYSQPLSKGLFVDKCFDVGRVEDVHFWPFWDNSEPMLDYLKANATAFIFARTDWEMVTQTFCLGYKVGFHFIEVKDWAGNVMFTNSGADICPTAVLVEKCQDLTGLSWSNCQFFGKIDVRSSNAGPVNFSNCSFWGLEPGPGIVTSTSSGNVTFTGCHFARWDFGNTGEPAISSDGARLTVTGCDFLDSGKKQVRLGAEFGTAVVTSNQMRGGKSIEKIGTSGELVDLGNTSR